MPPKSGSRVLWALCRLLVPILGAGFIVTLIFNKKSVLNNAKMFNKVADEGLAKTRLQKEVDPDVFKQYLMLSLLSTRSIKSGDQNQA